jgi:predicted MFS family arabinose efflux permease
MAPTSDTKAKAFRFVLIVSLVSLFADAAYEGARSILGPYLALLGATGAAVGIVTGFGELLGYGLRLVSGRIADRTRQFWLLTIAGYVVSMVAVPALALTGSWPAAATLLILERVGKAMRNPPRDVMLSHAGQVLGGYGWVFGIHEALDQFGALIGPLVVAAVLAKRGDYPSAFAILVVPALITIILVVVARLLYPRPEEMETRPVDVHTKGMPRVFWIYLIGAGLVGAGFADFPLIAFHFQKTSTVSGSWVPVFYGVAMGVSGTGSLIFGRLFDRRGLAILVPLTIVSALFAPLVFLGGFWAALAGAAVWGLGMGVHESVVPAAVAPMVSPERRASAYGLFTAGYGLCWFFGSAAIGILYDRSIPATIVLCVVLELRRGPIFRGGAKQNQGLAPPNRVS